MPAAERAHQEVGVEELLRETVGRSMSGTERVLDDDAAHPFFAALRHRFGLHEQRVKAEVGMKLLAQVECSYGRFPSRSEEHATRNAKRLTQRTEWLIVERYAGQLK